MPRPRPTRLASAPPQTNRPVITPIVSAVLRFARLLASTPGRRRCRRGRAPASTCRSSCIGTHSWLNLVVLTMPAPLCPLPGPVGKEKTVARSTGVRRGAREGIVAQASRLGCGCEITANPQTARRPAARPGPRPPVLAKRRLAGQVVEYPRLWGADRRIWSAALQQWRDLDVYLPPGYDPCRRYPVLLWLHGITQDEQSFVREA